ncbi:MAG: hypothetical protein WA215_14100 [Candidatus Cybelea sp.]
MYFIIAPQMFAPNGRLHYIVGAPSHFSTSPVPSPTQFHIIAEALGAYVEANDLTCIAPTGVVFAGKTPPLGVVWFVTRLLATHLSMGFRFKLIRRRLDVPADGLSRT